MDDKQTYTDSRRPRLTFPREFYTDYHTVLLSQIRTCDICNDVYTGALKHPLVELQILNQKQILDYGITLVAQAVLQHRPFVPTEEFIHAVRIAAAKANVKPPLDQLWQEFTVAWKTYKSAQRKIYATIVATLRMGSSMHYARSVPYGYGTLLLRNIMNDNRHNTVELLILIYLISPSLTLTR